MYLAIILALHSASASAIFNLVRLEDPEAVCLDGSPGSFYVYQGEEKTKFQLHFQGGSWCTGTTVNQTLHDCVGRFRDWHGSSKFNKATQDFSTVGWMTNNETLNPDFHNWTKIFINYCTGTGHQGHAANPYDVNGTQVYIRGQVVTLAIFNYLEEKYNMLTGRNNTVFLGGESAGGLAVYSWADYLKSKVAGRFFAVPDSGYFNDAMNVNSKKFVYRSYMQNLVAIANVEVDVPNKECAAYYKTQQWKCMLLDYLYPFLHTDMLVVQSLYDPWVTVNVYGVGCARAGLSSCNANDLKVLEDHRINTLRFLANLSSPYYSSAFGFACTQHCLLGNPYFYGPQFQIEGKNLQKVIGEFKARQFSGGYFDEHPWPSNGPCSKLSISGSII